MKNIEKVKQELKEKIIREGIKSCGGGFEMKLKTLKEMNILRLDNLIMDKNGVKVVTLRDLKQEAIKHIKAGRRGVFLGATIEDYIMWANNLKKEDLK